MHGLGSDSVFPCGGSRGQELKQGSRDLTMMKFWSMSFLTAVMMGLYYFLYR
jgi:hypothetical protein